MKQFAINEQVVVLAAGGWKKSSRGTVCGGPEPVATLQGPEYFYWVEFDEPQEDINGSDKYRKAQILSCYLERAI